MRDIYFRSRSRLKIPDERCRGKIRFPKRNEMLVHVDPLCINKMRDPEFSRLAPDGFANFDGQGDLTPSRASRRWREEMETKILPVGQRHPTEG